MTNPDPARASEHGPDAMSNVGTSGRRQLCIGLTTVTGEQVLIPIEQAVPDDFMLPPLQIPVVHNVSLRVSAVAVVDDGEPVHRTVIPDRSPAGAYFLDGSMRNVLPIPPGWPAS